MKKIKLTWSWFALILVGVLILLVIFRFPMNEQSAKITAETVFRSAAMRMKMMPNDFALVDVPTSDLFPNYPVIFAKYPYVTFVWQHKTKRDCKIEVDIDLAYVNARPIPRCD